jgi:hypothetical protein
MFKVLPDAEIRWRDTWIGAAMKRRDRDLLRENHSPAE